MKKTTTHEVKPDALKPMAAIIIALCKVILMVLLCMPLATIAQGDPPPPPDNHGESGNQIPGGGTPVGTGLGVMLGFGLAYGCSKLYSNREAKDKCH